MRSAFMSTSERVGESDAPCAAGPRTTISQTTLGVVPTDPFA